MKRGFTLIELMVVIGIVVLLTVGSIVGLVSTSTRRQAKSTAEKLQYVIKQAVSEAKNPNDSTYGLYKIEIDIYPDNSVPPSNLKNWVKVYYCYDAACTVGPTTKVENTKLSFEAKGGVHLDSDNPPNYGNMSCTPSCGSNTTYYYFNVCARAFSGAGTSGCSQIGQLADYTNLHPPGADSAVFLKVIDPKSNDTYKVKIYIESGLVVTEKMP